VEQYRLRLLKGDEIVAEEFLSAPNFNAARLAARDRLRTFRAAVRYEFTHELAFVGSED
jgi:hypothetical protein